MNPRMLTTLVMKKLIIIWRSKRTRQTRSMPRKKKKRRKRKKIKRRLQLAVAAAAGTANTNLIQRRIGMCVESVQMLSTLGLSASRIQITQTTS